MINIPKIHISIGILLFYIILYEIHLNSCYIINTVIEYFMMIIEW